MGTSTEELSGDIAQTRQSLTKDVDALQDRVSPSAIIERRKTAVRGRWTAARDRVMGSGHGLGSATSSAGGRIEDQVEGSPLAAGLVAFGAGLVIAGLIPATRAEAQGAQRLKEAAQDHGQPLLDEAKSAAQDMGDQLKGKASEAVDEVRSSAQESADRVRQETPGSSSDESTWSSSSTSGSAP